MSHPVSGLDSETVQLSLLQHAWVTRLGVASVAPKTAACARDECKRSPPPPWPCRFLFKEASDATLSSASSDAGNTGLTPQPPARPWTSHGSPMQPSQCTPMWQGVPLQGPPGMQVPMHAGGPWAWHGPHGKMMPVPPPGYGGPAAPVMGQGAGHNSFHVPSHLPAQVCGGSAAKLHRFSPSQFPRGSLVKASSPMLACACLGLHAGLPDFSTLHPCTCACTCCNVCLCSAPVAACVSCAGGAECQQGHGHWSDQVRQGCQGPALAHDAQAGQV